MIFGTDSWLYLGRLKKHREIHFGAKVVHIRRRHCWYCMRKGLLRFRKSYPGASWQCRNTNKCIERAQNARRFV